MSYSDEKIGTPRKQMGVLFVEVEQAKAIEPAIVAGIAKSVGVSEDAVEATSGAFSK